MPITRSIVAVTCLLMAMPACADDGKQQSVVSDVVYKGFVGKALDIVPMDPDERVVLQRTSAVVSGTLTGRSLAVWAGLTNPILLVAGLAWGLYSATNIKVAEARVSMDTIRVDPVDLLIPDQIQVAMLFAPPAEVDTLASQYTAAVAGDRQW